jgi:D-beta-D-heptose 7-phosphate kinase/D-beta-D-heptose 1-phosphate adenosyltransferase
MIHVIGDLLIDYTIHGAATRISPEAPTPVVLVSGEQQTLGGAGNVYKNCRSLNQNAVLYAAVGHSKVDNEPTTSKWWQTVPALTWLNKQFGEFSDSGIQLFQDNDYVTPLKTRIVVEGQQLLRVDRENSDIPVSDETANQLLQALADKMQCCSVVVISDYGKGLFNKERARTVIELANKYSVPILVDAKPAQLKNWAGATLCTPNIDEAIAYGREAGVLSSNKRYAAKDEKIEAAMLGAFAMVDNLRLRYVVLTMGDAGAALIKPLVEQNQLPLVYPAKAQRVYDVTGAGDSFMAALAVGIQNKWNYETAVERAVYAGSLAVQQHGVVCVTEVDWDNAWRSGAGFEGKLVPPDELMRFVSIQRAAGKKIALANGCFDVLHAGHIHMLKTAAAELNSVLLVAVDSDENVSRLKGPGRPMTPELLRQTQVATLPFVDRVTVFNGSVLDLIKKVNPDYLVKGGDYADKEVVGADYMESIQGKVVITSSVPGLSTTRWASND